MLHLDEHIPIFIFYDLNINVFFHFNNDLKFKIKIAFLQAMFSNSFEPKINLSS